MSDVLLPIELSEEDTPLVQMLTRRMNEMNDEELKAYLGDIRAIRQSAATRKSVTKGEGKLPSATKTQATVSQFFKPKS
jgi:hypothetical protein